MEPIKRLTRPTTGLRLRDLSFWSWATRDSDEVEAVGPNVTELKPGDFVVATVRRPGRSIYDLIGTNDMTTDDTYFERGINLRHGFLTEYYVDDAEFIVKVPQGLKERGSVT